jgi:4-amino-4-deoxy-L-arabinose transferase-like glycosyltransferase
MSDAVKIPRAWEAVIVGGLLLLYPALALTAARDKSFTFDEVPHLAAGATCWRFDDYRISPENGILTERWAGLATLADDYVFPTHDQPAWWHSNEWRIGDQFLFQLGNDATGMLFRARALMSLFGVAIALAVYLISRGLFGLWGGLLSLTLCVLCPNLLGHGVLITSDVPAAFFFLSSLWCLWLVLERVSPVRVLFSVLLLAGLVLTKYSALLYLPMSMLLVALRLAVGTPLPVSWRGDVVAGRGKLAVWLAGLAVVHILAVWALMWLAYGCRFDAMAESVPGRDRLHPGGWEELADENGFTERMLARAREYELLPEAYLYGLRYTLHKSQERSAFFNGERGRDGWITFFPYAFAVKTPLPSLFIVIMALFLAIAKTRQQASAAAWHEVGCFAYKTAPLWVLFTVYWLFAITSHLNIGHRHLLPTYPPLFVLLGWLGARPGSPRAEGEVNLHRRALERASTAVIVLLVGWLALDTYRIWPNYIAYFNTLAGGPEHAYEHLVDSSLDWGQDLPGLKKWLDEQGLTSGHTPVYLAYFGSARPEYYGIRARPLPSYPDRRTTLDTGALQPGVYCISATLLQGVYLSGERELWARHLEQAYQDFPDPNSRYFFRWRSLVSDLRMYDSMRFGRLCAGLRQRKPDAHAGHSILIYQLDAEELATLVVGDRRR